MNFQLPMKNLRSQWSYILSLYMCRGPNNIRFLIRTHICFPAYKFPVKHMQQKNTETRLWDNTKRKNNPCWLFNIFKPINTPTHEKTRIYINTYIYGSRRSWWRSRAWKVPGSSETALGKICSGDTRFEEARWTCVAWNVRYGGRSG